VYAEWRTCMIASTSSTATASGSASTTTNSRLSRSTASASRMPGKRKDGITHRGLGPVGDASMKYRQHFLLTFYYLCKIRHFFSSHRPRFLSKYVSPAYCLAGMNGDRAALVSHGEYTDGREMDRRTDARQLHYAFR